jgi:hypothetical protein
MSKETNENKKAEEGFEINVTEHEPFNGIVEGKYISSTEFCNKVSDLFRSVFNDFEGCTFEINQQGLAYITLYFNHSGIQTSDGRENGVTKDIPGKDNGISNELVRRIRQNDIRNKQGDRFYLTEKAMKGLTKFMHQSVVNRKDGKIQWEKSKIVYDVVQQQGYFNQPPINYTAVSMLDIEKLATEIYGSTTEDGTDNLAYGVSLMNSVNTRMVNGMPNALAPEYMLKIERVSEREVGNLCNKMGVSPSQGINIIR